jgi:twitching motility protein PilT
MDKKAVSAIFGKALELGASDVHVAVGCPIFFRIDGELLAQTKQLVTAEQADQCCKAVLGDDLHKRFTQEMEADASFDLGNGVRLRINCAVERGNMTLSARVIPAIIPPLSALDLEEIYSLIMRDTQGLVLFTGATGAGKSTSLAGGICVSPWQGCCAPA